MLMTLKKFRRNTMRRKIIVLLSLSGSVSLLLSGCAGDSYNDYDNRSYEQRKMDYTAQRAADDAAASLSAQDIKNINNLK